MLPVTIHQNVANHDIDHENEIQATYIKVRPGRDVIGTWWKTGKSEFLSYIKHAQRGNVQHEKLGNPRICWKITSVPEGLVVEQCEENHRLIDWVNIVASLSLVMIIGSSDGNRDQWVCQMLLWWKKNLPHFINRWDIRGTFHMNGIRSFHLRYLSADRYLSSE